MAMGYYQIPAGNLLVISDDLNLPVGIMRFRAGGSSGGHNGLRSIDEKIKTTQYARIRIGIGKPSNVDESQADFVLKKFSPEELMHIDQAVLKACDTIESWLSSKI